MNDQRPVFSRYTEAFVRDSAVMLARLRDDLATMPRHGLRPTGVVLSPSAAGHLLLARDGNAARIDPDRAALLTTLCGVPVTVEDIDGVAVLAEAGAQGA